MSCFFTNNRLIIFISKKIFFVWIGLCLATFVAAQVTTSPLASGIVYQIALENSSVYKLDYNFFKDQLGVNPATINPNHIKIYGNGGQILSENITNSPSTLQETAIYVEGAADNQFDVTDYVLFYGLGTKNWTYNDNTDFYNCTVNLYDNKSYYYIKIEDTPGKRIAEETSLANTDYISTTMDDFLHLEEERYNILDFNDQQGSGRRWYGDYFKNVNQYDYTDYFQFSELVDAGKIEVALAIRSGSRSRFQVNVAGQSFNSAYVNFVNISRPTETQFANRGILRTDFLNTTDDIPVSVTYSDGEAWLDYVTVNVRRALRLDQAILHFQDKNSIQYPTTTFDLSNATIHTVVWDISDPMQPTNRIGIFNNSQFSFGIATNTLRRFVAFNTNEDLPIPTYIKTIQNQDLLNLPTAELLIVYHTDFTEAVEQLAAHRRAYNGLSVATVDIETIYHEFSSGKQDPSAVRNFAQWLWEKDSSLQYLLLFGDGSFDYKDIKGEGNSNFIPVFETLDSENPINAFPSDDYFGLLEVGEGGNLRGDLDIAVGRLPVKTAIEANQLVDKLIHYDLNPQTLGDWRNRVAFVADDEDNNLHIEDTDEIAFKTENLYPSTNLEKIYLDAYPQESTSGGQGYPSVTEAINTNIFKGVLAINYLGHGGPKGWAQERVLDKDKGHIDNWTNINQLPLFITATCSFAGYDDRNQVTAGEQVLLNPFGGGIALFTTVRAVFASSNAALVRSVFDVLLTKKGTGKRQTLGDIFRIAKNEYSTSSSNSRKFTLLGDPTTPLALPLYNVQTTHINEQPIKDSQVDTLGALQQVTIKGIIADEEGQIVENFNGSLFSTVYDKKITYTTLAQDDKSQPYNFDLQKNILFKGTATVTNGAFEFSFIIPKDINYQYGQGKISYYAHDGDYNDATGAYYDIVIGGTNENLIVDDTGPDIQIYMDNEQFVFGGTTTANPLLLVKLQDDSGINVVGNSIGHDLEATLDEDIQNTLLLNDFYAATLNDYTSGEVRYPLSNLSEGRHTISVKAWDIANNSSEAYTEFVVATSEEEALQNVLNFPNPFRDNTCFEINLQAQQIAVKAQIDIYTINGQLVKTLTTSIAPNTSYIGATNCIEWNATSDSNIPLAEGLYIYKVSLLDIETGNIIGDSKTEKLVLLK